MEEFHVFLAAAYEDEDDSALCVASLLLVDYTYEGVGAFTHVCTFWA